MRSTRTSYDIRRITKKDSDDSAIGFDIATLRARRVRVDAEVEREGFDKGASTSCARNDDLDELVVGTCW